jgi:hypothetical protein
VAVNVPPSTGTGQLVSPPAQPSPLVYGQGAIDPESIAKWDGYYPDQWPHNTNGGANVIQLLVSAGPARLFGFQGINSNAAARFIQVHDSGVPVANGHVPTIVITAAIAGNFSWTGADVGRWFDQGIVIATSTTLATLTLGAADMWIDAQWA